MEEKWWNDKEINRAEAQTALDLLNEYLNYATDQLPDDEWERRVFELIENRRT